MPDILKTEKFSVEILKDLIIKKFPKFAVRFSETKYESDKLFLKMEKQNHMSLKFL